MRRGMASRVAAVLWLALAAGCASGPGAPEVHLFTWDNYDDPELFAEFERRHGMRVVIDRFASNEELLAKLMGGTQGYDLIVPSDYMVSIMAREGLLLELDKKALPNLSHMDSRFMGLYYDRPNRYSVPYLWGVTGIGYDSDEVSPAPEGWSAFWDPKYKGRMSLLNDQREVFALGLQSLGLRADTRDPADLRKVQRRLKEQKSLVKTYVSESMEYLLLSGEVVLAHLWSGDINRASEEKPSLRFMVPKEGGFIFQDNLCIPAGARNKAGALKLMDFLMEPANMARLVEKVRFGCPNRSAWKLLRPQLRANPTIVPQDALLKRLEWIPDPGSGSVYDRLWTELKAL